MSLFANKRGRVPPDPLAQEAKHSTMFADEGEKAEKLQVLLKEKLTSRGVPPEERAAWYKYKQEQEVKAAEAAVDAQFVEDFVAWVQGKGKEEDHFGVAWGRKPIVALPGIGEYLGAYSDARINFLTKLQKLEFEGPRDLHTAYLYFKYIVKARKRKRAPQEWLKDIQDFTNFDCLPPDHPLVQKLPEELRGQLERRALLQAQSRFTGPDAAAALATDRDAADSQLAREANALGSVIKDAFQEAAEVFRDCLRDVRPDPPIQDPVEREADLAKGVAPEAEEVQVKIEEEAAGEVLPEVAESEESPDEEAKDAAKPEGPAEEVDPEVDDLEQRLLDTRLPNVPRETPGQQEVDETNELLQRLERLDAPNTELLNEVEQEFERIGGLLTQTQELLATTETRLAGVIVERDEIASENQRLESVAQEARQCQTNLRRQARAARADAEAAQTQLQTLRRQAAKAVGEQNVKLRAEIQRNQALLSEGQQLVRQLEVSQQTMAELGTMANNQRAELVRTQDANANLKQRVVALETQLAEAQNAVSVIPAIQQEGLALVQRNQNLEIMARQQTLEREQLFQAVQVASQTISDYQMVTRSMSRMLAQAQTTPLPIEDAPMSEPTIEEIEDAPLAIEDVPQAIKQARQQAKKARRKNTKASRALAAREAEKITKDLPAKRVRRKPRKFDS